MTICGGAIQLTKDRIVLKIDASHQNKFYFIKLFYLPESLRTVFCQCSRPHDAVPWNLNISENSQHFGTIDQAECPARKGKPDDKIPEMYDFVKSM